MRLCLLNSSSLLTHVHLESVVLVTQQGLNPQYENYFSNPFFKREKENDREGSAPGRSRPQPYFVTGVRALCSESATRTHASRSMRLQQQIQSHHTSQESQHSVPLPPSGPASFPSSCPLQMLWVPQRDSPYFIHFIAPALRGVFMHLACFSLYSSCSHKCLVSLIGRI